MNVILITINTLEDVFQLFETINDSGIKLTVADLLKNKIISEFDKTNESNGKMDIISDEWAENLEEKLSNLIDKFLLHYFISKYGKKKWKRRKCNREKFIFFI
ncbi:hypothetical protein [Spiroplasma sp. SV19]|uniref:hypothetical protein n=1 Tax=Spiroplasma sp. SV19 TaxID=2570468 RepID=UPI0024B64F63|nr:hypothetical protein [Spiroplasma sp. SV19]WHQ37383.1 hypothetical protein E7Y35_05920 [Spiroplasma sp. SV19]